MTEPAFTVREAIARGTKFLEAHEIPTARLDTEILVGHVMAMDRLGVYLNMDRPVDEAERVRMRELLVRRAGHEPVAYITGRREFHGLDFEVSPAVLIPRPETEILVERARDLLAERFPGAGQLHVLEVGIGSGAIAVALCREQPALRVVATECSADAAAVAKRNSARLGVAERIDIRVQDNLDGVAGPFHCIVANPPYIPAAEHAELMRDVRDHEPAVALVGGKDGLAVARMILGAAPGLLAPSGFLLMELSPDTIRDLPPEAAAAGLAVREVIKDYAGLDRHVLLEPEKAAQ